ncbi:hypothetical protein ACWDYJ_15425 [Streptomyces sp. NPDC003042]
MLAFLGRHNTRAETIEFRRGALPPCPIPLHNLHRFRPIAESWHPWMLRILDVPEAVRLRGWPADLTTAVPIEIENEAGDSWGRWMFQVMAAAAEITPTRVEGQVTFTRRRLAVWYAVATGPPPRPGWPGSMPCRRRRSRPSSAVRQTSNPGCPTTSSGYACS